MSESNKLISPAKIGDLSLRCPLIMAPVQTGYGKQTGEVTEEHFSFWERRSEHAGAVIVEPFFLEPHLRQIPTQIGIHSDEMLPGLARLAGKIKARGARAIAHLNHPGRMANPAIPENIYLSSSDKPCKNGGKKPTRMNIRQIEEAQDLFAKAALRAEKAGFDLVELQFGDGYLIAQFLSPDLNDRDDTYGGTMENRFRFALEVLAKVKESCSLPVVARISGSEMFEGGFDITEMLQFSRALEKAGVSAINVSSGSVCETPAWHFQHVSIAKRKTWEMASQIKAELRVPVITGGQVNSKQDINQILDGGMADFATVGKQLIADPDFLGKVLGHIAGPVRPCLACLEGCVGGIHRANKLSCTINPRVGRDEAQLAETPWKKKIAVVGGGPAGMEAALVLKERGHDVTLFEKDKLGGQLNLASLAPRKRNLNKLIAYYKQRVEKEIKAVLRTPEPEELVREYELVLLAHGSVQADPNIPGLEEFAGIEILDPRNMPDGKNVVIIGEGFSAVDAAEALADNNNSVTLVCKSREILPDSQMISRNIAVRSLENLNVRILVKSEVTRKKGDRVFVNYQGREQVIEGVDRVVVLEGMLPSSDYEKELRGKVDLCKAGDCRLVGSAIDAIHSGYECARLV